MKCLLALLLIVVGATAAPAASPFHVLFAPAGGDDVTLRAEIAAELGADSIVDYFDARTGTPSMALLGEYDAVYTAAPFAYADPVLFGDRLAAIVDTGKHVMLGIYTHTQLSGLIVEDEYCPVPTYISAPDAGAGAWDGDQRHSVWDYVEGDLLSPVHQDLEPWAGTEIGAYEDGSTLLAIDFSQRVSYLNGRPVPVGVGQGNWPRLIANTLRFGEALRVAIYEPSLANSNFENRARFVNDVFTIFDDPTAMQQALESGDFDLAVVVEENVVLSVELADALASFVAAGGKAILSYWDLDGSNGPGAAAILRDTFGIAATSSFDQPQSISRWRDESRLYLDVQPYTPDGTSFLVDNGDRLSPAPGAVPLAGFTALPSANDAAIVIANGGRTIVNGFLFDDYAPVVRAVLSQREYDYLATLGRVLHMTTS
ncbi:MAG: hypothetical protein KDC38_19530, partial [Planctomycetes bacterium]|nr:hypothetical protein [Planctomycetota bacterium]